MAEQLIINLLHSWYVTEAFPAFTLRREITGSAQVADASKYARVHAMRRRCLASGEASRKLLKTQFNAK